MLNYNNLTNHQLFKLISAENVSIINFIYDKYAAAIYGHILQQIKSPEKAEDILCKTFLSCFQTKPRTQSKNATVFMYLLCTANKL